MSEEGRERGREIVERGSKCVRVRVRVYRVHAWYGCRFPRPLSTFDSNPPFQSQPHFPSTFPVNPTFTLTPPPPPAFNGRPIRIRNQENRRQLLERRTRTSWKKTVCPSVSLPTSHPSSPFRTSFTLFPPLFPSIYSSSVTTFSPLLHPVYSSLLISTSTYSFTNPSSFFSHSFLPLPLPPPFPFRSPPSSQTLPSPPPSLILFPHPFPSSCSPYLHPRFLPLRSFPPP